MMGFSSGISSPSGDSSAWRLSIDKGSEINEPKVLEKTRRKSTVKRLNSFRLKKKKTIVFLGKCMFFFPRFFSFFSMDLRLPNASSYFGKRELWCSKTPGGRKRLGGCGSLDAARRQ